MAKETQTIAIKEYIASLEAEMQQKSKLHKERFEDPPRDGFMDGELMSGVVMGLLVEEQEMWEKWLAEVEAA